MRRLIPWWLRIAAKICLSRLPISYGLWKRLRLFEHGDMEQPVRSWTTFTMHARTAGVLDEVARPTHLRLPNGETQTTDISEDFSILELGPGDSVFSALIARSLGASRAWLIDTGFYAVSDIMKYRAMSNYLLGMGLPAPTLSGCEDLDAVLECCQAKYFTNGVASLSLIPDASVDYCFSNAVLEHVDKESFQLLTREMRRILKPAGRACHRVDLKDHLGGGLANLRFDHSRWEGALFKSSGFYTNRIRFAPMLAMFEEAGFLVECPRIERWDHVPINRAALAPEFRIMSDADLTVSGFDIVLRPIDTRQSRV